MKGSLKFDPNDYDYGPATSAIRSIIVEWAEVDWFEPSGASDEELVRLFDDHNVLAHDHASQLFAEHVNVRVVSGGWSEFNSWCKRARTQTSWDWKFSVLKKLVHEHSKAYGWSLDTQALHVQQGPPRTGDLFVRLNDLNGRVVVVWNGFLPAPTLHDLVRSPAVENAQFYFGHAQADVFGGIQWQLAEKRGDLGGNPFVPLLRCYRAGGYPFSLERDAVVLFRFNADEHVLPKATLLPSRD